MAKEHKKKVNKKGRAKRIFGYVISTIIALLLVFCFWSGIDSLTGYRCSFFGLRLSVISTESMSVVNEEYADFLEGHDDRYNVNDLIFCVEVGSIEELEVYDVIIFLNNSGTLICHRVVRIDEADGKIWTRGDANNGMDGVIEIEDVKGKVVGCWPGVGIVTMYIRSPYGLLGISIAAFCLIAGTLFITNLEGKDEKKKLNKELNG